jgi:putative ABC transport system permease protein
MHALVANRPASALTLVGIILGVASIIAVMTALALVQATFEHEMSVLGSQTFQVQSGRPAGFASDGRAARCHAEAAAHAAGKAQLIRERVPSVDIVGSELWDFGFTAEYKGESTNRTSRSWAERPSIRRTTRTTSGQGRNLSPIDLRAAAKVAVIGDAIAQKLFPFVDPVGHDILVDHRKYEIIGVFDEKKSAFGGQLRQLRHDPGDDVPQHLRDRPTASGNARSVNITVRSKTPELPERRDRPHAARSASGARSQAGRAGTTSTSSTASR